MPEIKGVRFATLCLALVAAFLAFVIVSGTAWAWVTPAGKARRSASAKSAAERVAAGKPDSPTGVPGDRAGGSGAATPIPDAGQALFGDLGRLRAKTSGSKPAVIVVAPYISYPAADIAFREELVQKKRLLKKVLLEWFASRTADEIDSIGEAGVKTALIDAMNAQLVMGKIRTLYFSDFTLLD